MTLEIRRDIFGKEVIISTKRSKRPGAFEHTFQGKCPFCPGNEHLSQPTLFAYPDEKNWKIRIFPNKYPVVSSKKFRTIFKNSYEILTAFGVHNILVETPDHGKDYDKMSIRDISMIFDSLKKHYTELMKIKNINYVTIFKNRGERAGESIHHSHIQIIGSPLFPELIANEMRDAERFYEEKKECGGCFIIKEEIRLKKRVVYKTKDWVCFTPFVSTWPFQLVFYPRQHFSEISQLSSKEFLSLAKAFKKVFKTLYTLYPELPYNIIYHNYPRSDFWHFHLTIFPRLVTHAGFEFFGLNVNIISPEDAAARLRKIME